MIIWKENISIKHHLDETTITIPQNSKILKIAKQNGDANVWFECSPDNRYMNEEKTYICVYTGMKFESNNLEYIETIVYDTSFVIHIYEKIPFLSKEEMQL
jgi:hypothetical protein